MVPLLTTPWSLPPVMGCVSDVAAGGACVAGTSAAGDCAAGNCDRAARHAARTYPTALARLIAACRISVPTSPASIQSDEARIVKVYGCARADKRDRQIVAVNHFKADETFALANPGHPC